MRLPSTELIKLFFRHCLWTMLFLLSPTYSFADLASEIEPDAMVGGIAHIGAGVFNSVSIGLLGTTDHSQHTHADGQDAANSLLYGGQCSIGHLDQQFEDIEVINGVCTPTPGAGETSGTPRDLAICKCLRTQIGIQPATYGMIRGEEPELDENSLKQQAMNENVRRLNMILEAEQNAMQFHASTIPASSEANQTLISQYTSRTNTSGVADARAAAQTAYNSHSNPNAVGAVLMADIVVNPPSERLLSPSEEDRPHEYCVPLRSYMTAKQFPQEPEFFEDIKSLTAFRPDDWDYNKMKFDFIKMSTDVTTLEDALRKPQAKKLYQRLKFLERNPLYRNLFSSQMAGSLTKKQELFAKIKNAYGTNSSLDQKFEAFKQLRASTGEFFTSPPEIVAMTQDGASQIFRNLLREVPRRVHRVSQSFDPPALWDEMTRKFGDGVLASQDQRLRERTNVGIFARYCPQLEFASKQNQYMVLKELEEDFGKEFSTDPFSKALHSPETDYKKLNANLCNVERQAPGKPTKRWAQHLVDICGSSKTGECHPDNYPKLLAEFIDAYPAGNPSKENLKYLLPFLRGEVEVPRPSKTAVQTALKNGRDTNYINSAAARQGLLQANADIRSNNGGSSSSDQSFRESATRTPASTVIPGQATQTPLQQAQNPQFVPLINPVTENGGASVTPQREAQPSQDPARAETRVNPELQALRDEIAALGRDLQSEARKEPAQQNAQLMNDLNARLDQLNRRLDLATTDYENLRNQRSRTSRKSAGSDRGSDEDDSDDEDRQISGPQASSTIAQVASQQLNPNPSQIQGGSPLPGAVSSGGGTLGRAASASRRSSGRIDNALISARNSQNAGQSGNSAITVSNASSSEFQELRSQATGEAVSGSLPSEFFNRLAGGDTSVLEERFADQLPTETGEVRRYEIIKEGSQEKVELIVSRTENGLSVAFGQDRGPASVQPSERENTLENLNQRIQESR